MRCVFAGRWRTDQVRVEAFGGLVLLGVTVCGFRETEGRSTDKVQLDATPDLARFGRHRVALTPRRRHQLLILELATLLRTTRKYYLRVTTRIVTFHRHQYHLLDVFRRIPRWSCPKLRLCLPTEAVYPSSQHPRLKMPTPIDNAIRGKSKVSEKIKLSHRSCYF